MRREFYVMHDCCGRVVKDGAHVLGEGSVGGIADEFLVSGDVIPVWSRSSVRVIDAGTDR